MKMPIIETNRLVLRNIYDLDVFDLYEMRSNPEMWKYTDNAIDKNIDETKNYIKKMNQGVLDNKWFIWVLEEKNSKKVIGTIGIWNFNKELTEAEIGYGVNTKYQKKKFMHEALEAVCKFQFNDLKLKNLVAYTEQHNIPSIKLLEKSGFVKISQIKEEGYYTNKTYIMDIYQYQK